MSETLIIHSRKLAIYLQCRGFVLLGVEPDLTGQKKKVFLFKNSDAIRKVMLQYKHDREFHAFIEKMEGR
ncbi:DUF5659 domain-containing protein [Geobacillus sp. B4113_201601]|uniref:DUF5659 domain-containing protein n=1 Tax=Geobacillus sp. B4113_201601 TaxID=1586290 RepID=UPI000785679D|nr:DUF5659 domain-containing protein [Geobacillus sp. B4113_201601]KYD29938.1 hypothetical protein B4113_1173 [Geobacillus sp. B4113_201601]